jgi:hypothetical protein
MKGSFTCGQPLLAIFGSFEIKDAIRHYRGKEVGEAGSKS